MHTVAVFDVGGGRLLGHRFNSGPRRDSCRDRGAAGNNREGLAEAERDGGSGHGAADQSFKRRHRGLAEDPFHRTRNVRVAVLLR